MKKFVILLLLSSFGYACDVVYCQQQVRHMKMDDIFCESNEGIRHVSTIYTSFLSKKALDELGKSSIVDEVLNKKELKSTVAVSKKKGDIKCYLQNGNMYHSDEWIGNVKLKDNTVTYYSKYKEEKITVSGPCVVREEK